MYVYIYNRNINHINEHPYLKILKLILTSSWIIPNIQLFRSISISINLCRYRYRSLQILIYTYSDVYLQIYIYIYRCVLVCVFTYRTEMIRPIKKMVPKNPPIIRGTFNSGGEKTMQITGALSLSIQRLQGYIWDICYIKVFYGVYGQKLIYR